MTEQTPETFPNTGIYPSDADIKEYQTGKNQNEARKKRLAGEVLEANETFIYHAYSATDLFPSHLQALQSFRKQVENRLEIAQDQGRDDTEIELVNRRCLAWTGTDTETPVNSRILVFRTRPFCLDSEDQTLVQDSLSEAKTPREELSEFWRKPGDFSSNNRRSIEFFLQVEIENPILVKLDQEAVEGKTKLIPGGISLDPKGARSSTLTEKREHTGYMGETAGSVLESWITRENLAGLRLNYMGPGYDGIQDRCDTGGKVMDLIQQSLDTDDEVLRNGLAENVQAQCFDALTGFGSIRQEEDLWGEKSEQYRRVGSDGSVVFSGKALLAHLQRVEKAVLDIGDGQYMNEDLPPPPQLRTESDPVPDQIRTRPQIPLDIGRVDGGAIVKVQAMRFGGKSRHEAEELDGTGNYPSL